MTDFTKVNNVYYDVLQYNATSEQIEANSDTKLIYPLFNDANNYSVAINKATIDLSTVPLTQKNIGLKQYQVGLKIGTTEELSYVRQVNSNQNNFVWNCPQNGTVITCIFKCWCYNNCIITRCISNNAICKPICCR